MAFYDFETFQVGYGNEEGRIYGELACVLGCINIFLFYLHGEPPGAHAKLDEASKVWPRRV
jgi:hypothetical protein